MRKAIITILMMVPLMVMAQTQKVKLVGNEREFLNALASNTKVKIKDGVTINLSKVISQEKFFQGLPGRTYCEDIGYDRQKEIETVASQEVYDGRQLVLLNMHDLTIVGGKKSKIVVEPRYANVISLFDCKDIRLESLIIGHTDEGYCQGGVIYAEACENLDIKDCDLYGCGTIGLEARYSTGIGMQSSVIRDCSDGIMELYGCSFCTFVGCDFIRNREFTMFYTDEACRNISFFDCRFAQNKGTLFRFTKAVKMDGCEIHHPDAATIGTEDKIKYTGDETKWYVDNNALPERKASNSAVKKVSNGENSSATSLKERVHAISGMYAEAKEMAEMNGKYDTPRNDIELTANYMVPACGPTTEITRFYYELQADGEEMVSFYQPYLITRKYNIAARNFYEEYIFDRNRRQVVFIFVQEKSEDDAVNEVRYYWGEDENGNYGVIQQSTKGTAPIAEDIALRKCNELVSALNSLLNQDF